MVGAWQTYTQSLRLHYKRFRGTWPPTTPLSLGDFGFLMDGIFVRRSNLKDAYQDGLAVIPRPDKGAAHWSFSSAGSTSISAEAGGTAAAGGGSLKISFAREHAVFFNAAGCQLLEAGNYDQLAAHVLKLWKAEMWDDSYYVVTSVVAAQTSLALVSGGADAEAVIDATGGVAGVDLADANLRFALRHKKSLALDFVATKPHTPLIGLSRLRPRWLTYDADFRPSFVTDPDAAQDTMKLRTEMLRGAARDDEFLFAEDVEG